MVPGFEILLDCNNEVLELESYYGSEPSPLTLHTIEDDDIDARLAALNQKLMVHSLRIMTLENAEYNEERMEGNEPEHLPQPIASSFIDHLIVLTYKKIENKTHYTT